MQLPLVNTLAAHSNQSESSNPPQQPIPASYGPHYKFDQLSVDILSFSVSRWTHLQILTPWLIDLWTR